ncbi:MAG: RAMP superfamily CRISPR-associated protein, partial [Bacteroidota bacterium]|nr:RAMP superfamily CRISPR-associated protein [Bacteroidota bacterium]
MIPATTIKGWLREAVERTLRGWGIRACDGSSPKSVCGMCPVCEVWGSPQKRSPLRFWDVKLSNALSDVRTSVSLSRYRRAAYEERLFSIEVGWQP